MAKSVAEGRCGWDADPAAVPGVLPGRRGGSWRGWTRGGGEAALNLAMPIEPPPLVPFKLQSRFPTKVIFCFSDSILFVF